jgi:uncharacterized protein
MNLFVVPTIGFKLLYAFVIVRLDRRALVWINVTTHPTAEWVARQITEAFPWDMAPRYMIRDRDRIYGAVVTRRLRAMGIRDKPTAPASPWQNGFSALDPFFDIVRQSLAGLVDGDHYFDTIAPDAVFEFRYRFPTKLVGREALMALYAGYGEGMALHGADALVVNISQTPGVVILEYEVQGNAVGSGKLYENRFISVVTIEDRKIVGWRDYMDSLAAMSSLI